MANLIDQFQDSLAQHGLGPTLGRVATYPWRKGKELYFTRWVLRNESVERRFEWIYKHNHWGSEESISGPGSTMEATLNLRRELPPLVRRFGIQTVLDVPCGDFRWMSQVLPSMQVSYIGGDIVRPLIGSLQQQHAREGVSFVCIDLMRDRLPAADLLLCRDCLFHFSYEDTRSVLENVLQSNIRYLLTTSHSPPGSVDNRDIKTGEGRRIDLFAPPYNFPSDPVASVEDWIAPFPRRHMHMWSREQIRTALQNFAKR